MSQLLLTKRREAIFGISILLAGASIAFLSSLPVLLRDCSPQTLLPTFQQERFFFDLMGLIAGSWLLCWVCALNSWSAMSRAGQWVGIVLLCLEEVILVSVWHDVAQQKVLATGVWSAPLFVQIYVLGCFFGFFTLPSLTQSGNRTLTGLGALVLLLPWLCGHDCIVGGVEYLRGFVG